MPLPAWLLLKQYSKPRHQVWGIGEKVAGAVGGHVTSQNQNAIIGQSSWCLLMALPDQASSVRGFTHYSNAK